MAVSLNYFLCSNWYVFSSVGITASILFLLKFLQIVFEAVRIYVLPRFQRSDLKEYGKWAVITGSTDGIGKSYARQLAKRKMDLVLVSRNYDKLQATANEIERDFGVTVKTIEADFVYGWDMYQAIKEQLQEEEIGILVNNVGVLSPHPCYFLYLTEEEILDSINVNVNSHIIMTSLILPRMIERSSGIIVNVCGLMSEYIAPLASCFGACKSLTNAFSLALYWENRHSGVYVQTLATSCVTTKLINFTNIWKYLRPFVTDPDTYTESAVRMLGRTSQATGYWGHSVQYLFLLMPKIIQKYSLYLVHLFVVRNKPQR